ncbi:CMP-N-acetylneuraminate-beta-galactosamide-alpha-2,3-sialyltransferase 1-like [Parambassis ranga]|uniref:CMP-N-acetylneuraminate-beta-galactosamide-alpha-2,3-sialyltransferase 2 n=1 Tax=Parambassis ranga TaxID=210632 RepID=A0A6P7HTH6_9TELE|nr:CMP-N-acetylneuraminate-beta-galactosamide-alpha-2,3-sialyltransferase 1-like [Parambassis ranga]
MMFKWKLCTFFLYVTCVCVMLKINHNVVDWVPTQIQCACQICLEDNQLPVHRFNASPVPFLYQDCKLEEDTFNWWKEMQTETRNFSTYRKTVQALFDVIPPSPDLIKATPDVCRTCAVVGNSGNLKGSHYGRLIDVHDIVIRMNSAQTGGFEEDVGTRTTHRVMYPESAVDLDNSTHLVLVPFKILDLEWVVEALTTGFTGQSYAPVKSKITANKDLVMVVNPEFMRYIHETWLKNKGKYPSTGFMALILALHICDEVYVFGYGADGEGNWSHYWEKLKDKHLKTGVHSGNQEYDILQELAKQKTVTFYRGW